MSAQKVQAGSPNTGQPLGLALGKEEATLLIDGLEMLPSNRRNIKHTALLKQLKDIITIWDRRVKNEIILKQERSKTKK